MHLEAFLLDLVTAENTQQSVLSQESFDRFFAEVVGAVTLWVLFEVSVDSLLVIHRISPHQVTENAIQWDLLFAVYLVNLVKLFQARGDATVHGQIATRDVASNRHGVKDFHEQVIDFNIEALQDFITESESFSHVARLMVAPQQDDILREV